MLWGSCLAELISGCAGMWQVAAAAAAAAAAAEATRIELQTELNAGRQRIGAAEKARLELEARPVLPSSRATRV